MTPIEAAEVIEAMAASLKANPAQFQIEINVSGQVAMNTGGVGFLSNPVGGGPGSITIGNQVNMGGAQIEIAQKRAGQAMDQQLNALVQTLQNIAAQLRAPTPDRTLIQRTMASLKNTWVPGVITSVAGNVLTKALGL
jgi:outer membrane protein TolC